MEQRVCNLCSEAKPLVRFDKSSKRYRNHTCTSCKERKKRDTAKAKVFAAYGEVCGCCGEWRKGFLTIDHLLDDGHQHRNKFSSGRRVYADILTQGCPQDKYGIRCYNCNCGRVNNGGICPHELEKGAA